MSMEGPPRNTSETKKTQESRESIPTREEILLQIGKYCEAPVVTQEKSDEKGIYLLRAEVAGAEGEVHEYTYIREGNYPETNSGRTSIVVAHLNGDEVVFAEDKAHYDPATKTWH